MESRLRDLVREAMDQLAAGEVEAALRGLGLVLQQDPAAAQGATGVAVARGLILLDQGRFTEAERDFLGWLAHQPEDAAAWLGRGRAEAGLGRHEAALASMDRALALRPGWGDAHWHRGCSRAALLDLDAAMDDLDRALEALPPWARLRARELRIRLARAQLRLAAGRPAEAREDIVVAAAICDIQGDSAQRERILAMAAALGLLPR